MRDGRAGGFALVELMIVIIFISILSGFIMLSMGRGDDAAKATRIAADLDALKSAVQTYSFNESYNKNAFDRTESKTAGMIDTTSLDKYLDRDMTTPFKVTMISSRLMVGFTNLGTATSGTKQALANKGSTAGLYGPSGAAYTKTDNSIYVQVR